jgi:hypothetical protein
LKENNNQDTLPHITETVGGSFMHSYFFGVKKYGPFELNDGRTSISYSFIEQWVSTNRSHTVRCKVGGKMGYSITSGISVAELDSFKSSITSTLGVKGIASIQGDIEANTQITTTFVVSNTASGEFSMDAPGCGRHTYFLNQLVRDYQFVIKKPRLVFGHKTTAHNLREWTYYYDMRQETDEQDPQCPCLPKVGEDDGETVVLKIGTLSLRLDGKRNKENKVSFKVGRHTYSLDATDAISFPVSVKITGLPKMFQVLSGINRSAVAATVELEKDFELDDLRVREGSLLQVSAGA